jgi:hypothetical protein
VTPRERGFLMVKQPWSIYIEIDLYDRVKKVAHILEITLTDVINEAIRDSLPKIEKRAKKYQERF